MCLLWAHACFVYTFPSHGYSMSLSSSSVAWLLPEFITEHTISRSTSNGERRIYGKAISEVTTSSPTCFLFAALLVHCVLRIAYCVLRIAYCVLRIVYLVFALRYASTRLYLTLCKVLCRNKCSVWNYHKIKYCGRKDGRCTCGHVPDTYYQE